jgi:predicted Zn-dependent peptidase
MEEFYTPDRLVISIAGNVKASRILSLLEKTIGKLERKGRQITETSPLPLAATKTRYKEIEQVHLVIGSEGLPMVHNDRFVLALLDSILGGGMSSRLFQEIREKRGLAYSISSFEILYRSAGIFGIYAATNPKSLSTVIELATAEVGKVKDGLITEDELMRAKQQLRGSMLLSLEMPRHRMSRMARNELYFGRLISPTEVIASIEAVQLADLRRIANQLFKPNALTATVVGPIKKLKLA